MNKKLGKIHFWCMFIFFNMTFFPMFLIGLLGQPRRVFEYAQNLQALNDFASVSAFLLGASFLDLHRQLRVVDLHQAHARRRTTRGTRWASSGRPRRRCRTTTSSASPSSSATRTTTARSMLPRSPTSVRETGRSGASSAVSVVEDPRPPAQ